MKGMMKVKICILSGTPKSKGLCQSVIEAARQGIADAGGEMGEIRLCGSE